MANRNHRENVGCLMNMVLSATDLSDLFQFSLYKRLSNVNKASRLEGWIILCLITVVVRFEGPLGRNVEV